MKLSLGDRVFNAANLAVLSLFFLMVLYPLVFIVSSSLSSGNAIVAGKVWLWPVDFSLEGYKAVFKYKMIMSGYGNSLFYMIAGTAVNIVMTVILAYPLSRDDYKYRGIIMKLIVFTMLFRPGMMPEYLLVKNLGLLDSRWAMLLPRAIVPYNRIITRPFFQKNIPKDMLEAARIDGCDDYNFFFKIVLPLSKQIIAVITLFYAVAHWNRFFDAILYLSNQKKFPLQLVLREILVANTMDSSMMDGDLEALVTKERLQELLKYSVIVVASLPLMVMYPFIQKYFVKGVMIGAIKG